MARSPATELPNPKLGPPPNFRFALNIASTRALQELTDRPIQVLRYTHDRMHYSKMHHMVELGIVLKGCVERRVAGRRWQLQRGEAWMIRPWEAHVGRPLEQPCQVVEIYALPQVLTKIALPGQDGLNWLSPFTAPPRLRPSVPSAQRERVARLAWKMDMLWNAKTPARKAWVPHYLNEILLILMDHWTPPATDLSFSNDAYRSLEKAFDLVLSRRTRVTIAEAARACNMSETGLYRLFRNLTGLGFQEFALRHRIGGAAYQLRSTDDSSKKVSHDWGFYSVSHFDRLFYAHYHCTPSEYRKRAT